MNPSYLNGPIHQLAKRFRPTIELLNEDHYPSLPEVIQLLRFIYCYIRYLWSNSDGPVFMVKLWMLIMDRFLVDFTLLIKIQFVGVQITHRF